MRLMVLFAVLTLVSSPLRAEIVLGISNAQAGPSYKLGTDLNKGAELYLNKHNQSLHSKNSQIKLLKLDDGYEPVATVNNTKELLSKDVLALFNYVGTPTTSAIMPIMDQLNIPLVTPFTGADFLRSPFKTHIYNLRASYEQEAFAQVDYLFNQLKIENFALMIQADAFGLALEKYYLKALKQYNKVPLVRTRYRRNTSDVLQAANELKTKDIGAVLFVGTYTPLSILIRKGQIAGFNPVYSTVSFVSSQAVFDLVPENSKILVTEVVPNPKDCQLAICKQFRRDASAVKLDDINQVHFEGYLNAMFIADAIRRCKNNINHQCLNEKLTETKIDFGGIKANFNPETRQALDRVYYSTFNLPKPI